MPGPRRFAVLVRADERDVEIVAGEVEVVGIAAEERDGHLRREHQAHVLEPLVSVEAVLAAVIQLDHVAAELVVPGRAVLLDRSHRGLALVVELLARLETLRRSLDLRGDVGDLDQLVELDLRALDLVLLRLRVEALGDEVLLLRRELLDAGVGAMVIRQHQPLRRDEASGATAREAHRRELRFLQPARVRPEPMLLLHLPRREVVEGPHPLVGARSQRQSKGRQNDQSLHRWISWERGRCFVLQRRPPVKPGIARTAGRPRLRSAPRPVSVRPGSGSGHSSEHLAEARHLQRQLLLVEPVRWKVTLASQVGIELHVAPV